MQPSPSDRRLIYDIGMYNALDTAFYLNKGFRVIAVEANPIYIEQARARFSEEIAAGLLTIYDVALTESTGHTDLYVHEHDDWTRVDKDLDGRFPEGTFHKITVPTMPFSEIYARHDTPYYVKLDIRGSELPPIRDILASGRYPEYISFEWNLQLRTMLDLCMAHGYDRFNIVPQRAKSDFKLPDPPLEGNYVPVRFNGHMTGPFGREVPGDWLTRDQLDAQIAALEAAFARGDEDVKYEWHDIHAWRAGTVKANSLFRRFGSMFAADIRRRRIRQTGTGSH